MRALELRRESEASATRRDPAALPERLDRLEVLARFERLGAAPVNSGSSFAVRFRPDDDFVLRLWEDRCPCLVESAREGERRREDVRRASSKETILLLRAN